MMREPIWSVPVTVNDSRPMLRLVERLRPRST